MLAVDVASVLAIVGGITVSLSTLIAAVFAGMAALRVARVETKVDHVHSEVQTINGRSLAQLADAGETRRIEGIPVADRTDQEQHHVDVVPDPANPFPPAETGR